MVDPALFALSRVFAKPYSLTDFRDGHVLERKTALRMLDEAGEDSLTWLGHCSFLIRKSGRAVLTDPFLEGYCGPRWMRSLKRLPSGLESEDLPDLDTLLISHMHRDHLHPPSLERLSARNAVVPSGVGKRLRRYDIETITEVGWYDTVADDGMSITALPAIHYSELPCSRSLWAGYKIAFDDGPNIYFAGDTGYGPIFSKMRDYGPFDVAMIGIGTYAYRRDSLHDNVSRVHTNPEKAVSIAKDIGARKMIGMHWGTVNLSEEPPEEPARRLKEAAECAGIECGILRIGETVTL